MESKKKTITLRSSDGEAFEIPANVAAASQIIKNMIDDGFTDDVISLPPSPYISGKILSKVIDYCKRHVRSGPGNVAEDGKKLMEWDAEFVDVDPATLLDLIRAANYLDIPGIMDLTCQAMADFITRKTPEEIRKAFNIKNDFTPEDLEELFKSGHQWLE